MGCLGIINLRYLISLIKVILGDIISGNILIIERNGFYLHLIEQRLSNILYKYQNSDLVELIIIEMHCSAIDEIKGGIFKGV